MTMGIRRQKGKKFRKKPDGLHVVPELVNIEAQELHLNYLDHEGDNGGIPCFLEVSNSFRLMMPNPLRELAQGDELFTFFIMTWADDVGGNISKLVDAFKNIYLTHVNLPGHLLQQEFFVHFVATSQHASMPEQFEAVLKVIRMCRFRLVIPALPADNPQQSEEASHIGPSSNCKCHRCLIGGGPEITESNEGYHALHIPGPARTVDDTKKKIHEQLEKAGEGKLGPVTSLQTSTDMDYVKQENPNYTKKDDLSETMKWLNSQPGDPWSPLLDFAGLDPHCDTPVEILHMILLGIIKYVWHNLAAGCLGTVVWYHEIPDMQEYLCDIRVLIGNILDSFDLVDPARIITKAKIHVLMHLPDDIQRFGPVIQFATEVFECFNHIFRMCSVLSNHQAPGCDIARKCTSMEHVKHIASGGYWKDENDENVQASPKVQKIICQHPIIQTHLGWGPHSNILPCTAIWPPKSKQITLTWSETGSPQSLPSLCYPPSSMWVLGVGVTSISGDMCPWESWVVANGPHNTLIVGRVHQVLIPKDHTMSQHVVINSFSLGVALHPAFDMPTITRDPAVLVLDISFIINIQHDCHTGHCFPNGIKHLVQEHEVTDHTVDTLTHQDDRYYVINLAALLCQALPCALTQPHPLHQDHRSFHDSMAASPRVSQPKKREDSKAKAKLTHAVNKAKKKSGRDE
ncbi:hypothetical protein K439DRAFT_1618915 [Ramaria rubella]|nr:hypothetical protein K439DRAFT_1618915 [Ramaria rubella]